MSLIKASFTLGNEPACFNCQIMIHHKHQQTSRSDQSGFTIIESLVALMVAAILLTAIAPVIVLSVATRVQAKRVELATDAAKNYIDSLKGGRITPPPITKKAAGATTDPALPDAPSGTLTCTKANDYCSSPISTSDPKYSMYCVDGDDSGSCTIDNPRDMVVQVFGYNGVSDTSNDGYKLGMRVYRAQAFKTDTTLKASKDASTLQTEGKLQVGQKAQESTFTGGTGLKSIQFPLFEITTEISNKDTTFSDFCDRLKPAPPAGSPSGSSNPQSKC
jgi:prepilin-type N-terminal cleavage/methylation domain-containing protein